MGFFRSVGDFFRNNWKTIAVVAAAVVVGVGLTVLTGGLLGVPAMAALGGGLFGGGLAATTAAAVGAFGAGVASYALGQWLDDRPLTWRGALWEGTKSVIFTFATLGLARGLSAAAPAVSRAIAPVTRPAGEAIANTLRPVGAALKPVVEPLASVTRPVANAVVRATEGLENAGAAIRRSVLGRNPTAAEVEAAVQQEAAAVRAAAVSKAKTPHVTAGVVDGRTGEIFYGTSSGGAPYTKAIHPELAARLPADTERAIAGRAFQNCAEFDAINNALKNGARWEDLGRPFPVATKDGFAMAPCPNCQQWIPRGPPVVEAPPLAGAGAAGPGLGVASSRGFLGALDDAGQQK